MYAHTYTSKIVSYTNKRAEDRNNRDTIPFSQAEPHQVMQDVQEITPGVWVVKRLANFMAVLRNQIRGIEFGVTTDCSTKWMFGDRVFREVYAYFPNQPYALGRVGYGDPTVDNDSDKEAYWVLSRTIFNAKYAAHRDQYNMVTTKDVNKAVKEAKKSLRSYSPLECALATKNGFVSFVEDEANNINSGVRSTKNKVSDSPDLLRELQHILELSNHGQYQFLSEILKTNIQAWKQATDEWAVEKIRAIPACFVNVTVIRDKQRFDVVDCKDAKNMRESLGNDAPTNYYYEEDLPPELLGKLSVLSLLEHGQYSKGVGLRITDTMFWVEK